MGDSLKEHVFHFLQLQVQILEHHQLKYRLHILLQPQPYTFFHICHYKLEFYQKNPHQNDY